MILAPVFAYQVGHKDGDLSPNDEDDAWGMARCPVVDPSFDWDGDRLPRSPWSSTIIHELHVKGITARHPEVAAGQRGMDAGLASPPVMGYLSSLGVTAVELLPVHDFLDDRHLVDGD